jgi:hypothetical protein
MTGAILKQQLSNLPIGGNGEEYRDCVLQILQYLFKPDLTDGRVESGAIIFDNASERSFWAFLRWEHDASFVIFQPVDAAVVDDNHLNQTNASLVIVVTRSAPSLKLQSKTYAMFTHSIPRKTILILSDVDLKAMLDLKTTGRDPASYLQTIYRGFRDSVR